MASYNERIDRMMKNSLFYGDNLPLMREKVLSNSVDLIYLDPPFKSDIDYNVLFKADGITADEAQMTIFKDTWTWDTSAQASLDELQDVPNVLLVSLVNSLNVGLEHTPMMAYIVHMAARLFEMRRVLKPTGSIYLHCDPTASHYLKLIMDAIFLPNNFRSEIIWRRTGSHNKARRWAPIHDVILFYTKSDTYTWNSPRRPYMLGHVTEHFIKGEDGTYRTDYYGNVLTGSGTRKRESGASWKGFNPTAKGRHWAIPSKIWEEVGADPTGLTQHQKMDLLYELGYITITEGEAWPMYQLAVRPGDGPATPDLWAYQPYTEGTVFGITEGIDADVRWLSPQDSERLRYPTQKPVNLLRRIIQASSNAGDLVLDPFCGCGTTIEAAQILARRWIGMDISPFSIELIRRQRLEGAFPHLTPGNDYEIKGLPTTLEGARMMALEEGNRKSFEIWAVSKVDGIPNPKPGSDKGIDGRIPFKPDGKTAKFAVVSVKSGKLKLDDIRALKAVSDRERATSMGFGVLVTLNEPTSGMIADAASAGTVELHGIRFPYIQILRISEVLDGKRPHLPLIDPSITYGKRARSANLQSELL